LIEKEELLTIMPHSGKMLLISRIKCYNLEERIIHAEYDITEDCLFYDPVLAGVPAWVGFEFIAQAIAAISGLICRERGEKPKLGFILSVSAIKTEIPFFRAGSTVEIKAKEVCCIDSIYTFGGEVLLEEKKAIEGKLMLFDVGDEKLQILKKEYGAIE
jgi:predicted hotdog family 3-hydroxylacyl-ACP dehydratase